MKEYLLNDAIAYAKSEGSVSQTKLQLKFSMGYMWASNVIQHMESHGMLEDANTGNYVTTRKVKP